MRHQGIHRGIVFWLQFLADHWGYNCMPSRRADFVIFSRFQATSVGVLILLYRPAVDEEQSTIPPASRNGIKMLYNIFRYPHL
ncbi:hypothetical protein T03_13957 [Trichinella britovi]|uniref:Uncharacterized protein n=1 Tax=Trichinella britovi TaxID=45882 RepID=A0A0V1ALL4_TRIBR|nr:hypothetical protein T03_17308 [Trichinella britovi]KRY26243.1 hypothetical protein T03_13957 [Trichinella britovi]